MLWLAISVYDLNVANSIAPLELFCYTVGR